MSGISWVTAFLDTDQDRAPQVERFWCAVTGSLLSPRRGSREEFVTLLPPDGEAFLKAQTVGQSPPGGMHLDLHTDDIDATCATLTERGVPFTVPPHDEPWGRWAQIADPDGNEWGIWAPPRMG